MKDIRLLALDLDGTVLRTNNTLSPKVKQAIIKAAESGLEIVVASGRPYTSMPKEILGLGVINYYIASNGAAIYNGEGKRLRSVMLSESDVLKLLKLTESYDLIWEAFTERGTCTDSRYYNDPTRYGCSEAYIEYVQSSRGSSGDMRGYIYEHRKCLDSVEFVATDSGLRAKLWAMIEKNIPSFYVTSSSRNFVEIMDGEATKANALGYICEKLGISPQDTAAAGNADNDVDMINIAGVGAAVKNASKSCLEAADIVVASNDDDGVAELIEILK